jgi:hypothetical protein
MIKEATNDTTSTVIADTTITTTSSSTSTSSSDNEVKERIKDATKGLPSSSCFNYLSDKVLPASKENALTICDYIFSLKSEINPSNKLLLSTFFDDNNNNKNAKPKPFKEMTRQDLLSFLDSYRKPKSVDLLDKWIGTYNLYRIHLMRFFKWLYSPDVEPDKRPKRLVPFFFRRIY